jgi:uncharacterized membrane protein
MLKLTSQRIAVIAVMAAVITVFTLAVRVPIPGTPGYINFSDVAIYFASLAFGPWIGFIASGVGTALADLIGYPATAPLTFFAHGLEGLIAGWIAWRSKSLRRMLLAWLAGAIVMVGLYFLGEVAGFAGYTVPQALTEAPFNILQVVAGGLIGIPLVYAVRRAYPPIDQIGQGKTWKEL